MGQSVFAVVAEDIKIARNAIELADIRYEELPAVITIDQALETGNVLGPPAVIECGEADQALDKSKHKLEGKIIFSQGITSQDNNVDFLAERMKEIVEASSDEKKLNLLKAHPELAGKLAVSGNLTKDSTAEQTSAGLDQCSKEEFAEFSKLNLEYTKKFGHPFIIAVRGLKRSEILTSFNDRVNNDSEKEFSTAMEEVHKIARLRLEQLSL